MNRYRQQRDEDYRKKRIEAGDKDGFHFSGDITKPGDDELYCSRKLEIGRRFVNELKPWRPDFRLQRTFEHGHSIHRMMQTWLRDVGPASNFQAGLYGKWQCRKCDREWVGFSPTGCSKCKANLYSIKYREYPLINKRFQTTTTSDGLYWVKLESGWKEYLLEIKSIKQRQMFYGDLGFDDLTEPMQKHRGQAQGYAALRRLELEKGPRFKLPHGFTEWPKLAGIIYLYYGKDSDDIKEYHEKLKLSVWKTISERIKTIQVHEENGTFSPRIKKCKTLEIAEKETKCPLAEKCFELSNKKGVA